MFCIVYIEMMLFIGIVAQLEFVIPKSGNTNYFISEIYVMSGNAGMDSRRFAYSIQSHNEGGTRLLLLR